MIVFDQVTVRFGNGTRALSHVSFALGAGEFVVIEGPSGAGKTTLMRSLIKDVVPIEGKIVVDGDDLARIPPRNIPLLRRKVGVVFQDFKLLADRTVGENIDIALDLLGLADDVITQRRTELLNLTGLLDKTDHFPVQLSGGELQRVAIARALAPAPKILFADEPTGNLDSKTGASIIKLLTEINEQGTTVLLSSHDLELLHPYKFRRLKMDKGELKSDSAQHHKSAKLETTKT